MDHLVWPSTQASLILKLPGIGAVQDHSGHTKNKSTVDTAAALLEGNFIRPRRHRADSYKYSACRPFDHLAEPNDF